MGKPKYILTADTQGPIERALGQKQSRVAVYDDKDLQRRLDAAKKANVKVSVKRA